MIQRIAGVPATPPATAPKAATERTSGGAFASVLGSSVAEVEVDAEQDGKAKDEAPDEQTAEALLAMIGQVLPVEAPRVDHDAQPVASVDLKDAAPARPTQVPLSVLAGSVAIEIPDEPAGVSVPAVGIFGDQSVQDTGESLAASPVPDEAAGNDVASLLRRLRNWVQTTSQPAEQSPAERSGKGSDAATVVAPLAAAPLPNVVQTVPQTTPAVVAAPAPASVPVDVAETVLAHQLDLARDGQWLDRLARDIAASADGNARLRFQLNPEHLGSLHVEVARGADGASIRLTADSEAARSILASAEHRLLAEARAQGVRIAETRIDLGQQGMSQHQGQQPKREVRTIGTGRDEQPIATVEAATPPPERFA